jgi:hypothetical protein
MPSVNPGESQKDYVSRAIPVILNEGTTKDPKQAAAIAYSMYRRRNKKSPKYANYKAQKEAGPGE